MHRSVTKLIKVHESSTVRQLVDIAYDAFCTHATGCGSAANLAGCEHVKSAHASQDIPYTFSIERSQVRLRIIDSVKNEILSPVEFGGNPDATLKSYSDSVMNKIFHFEMIMNAAMQFQPSAMTDRSIWINLIPYSPVDQLFLEAITVFIPQSMKMSEVHSYLLSIAHSLAITDSGAQNVGEAVVLEDISEIPQVMICDSSLVRDHLKVGQTVYAETGTTDSSIISVGLQDFFRLHRATFKLKIIVPFPNSLLNITVAPSSSMKELKEEIGRRLDIPICQFSLHKIRPRLVSMIGSYQIESYSVAAKGSAMIANEEDGIYDIGPGQELKNLLISVSAAGLDDLSEIEVCCCPPLDQDEFRVAIFLDSSTIPYSDSPAETNRTECAYEVTASTQHRFVGDVVVNKNETVSSIKDKVLLIPSLNISSDVNIRLRLGKIAVAPLFSDSIENQSVQDCLDIVNIYLLNRHSDINYIIKGTNKILIDENTISDEIKLLQDGIFLICQLNVPEKVFSRDSMLINAYYWHIDTFNLESLGEAIISTATKLEDLKRLIQSITEKNSSGKSCIDGESDTLCFVRPFTWQLQDISNFPDLKWLTSQSDTSFVAAPPLRLTSGSAVLCTSLARLEALLSTAHEAKMKLIQQSNENQVEGSQCNIDSIKMARGDVAFRILSISEQLAAKMQ